MSAGAVLHQAHAVLDDGGGRKGDEGRAQTGPQGVADAHQNRQRQAGDAEDQQGGFQLAQALNQLKGRTVMVSKTLTERKEEKKEN